MNTLLYKAYFISTLKSDYVTLYISTILFDVNATMGLGGEFMVFYSRDSQIYFNRL